MDDRLAARLRMRRRRSEVVARTTCLECEAPLPPRIPDAAGLLRRGPPPDYCTPRCRNRAWRRSVNESTRVD